MMWDLLYGEIKGWAYKLTMEKRYLSIMWYRGGSIAKSDVKVKELEEMVCIRK